MREYCTKSKVDGRKLLIQMAEKGFSCNELAKKAKSTTPTISRILHGSDCTIKTIHKVAKALGCNVADIVADDF